MAERLERRWIAYFGYTRREIAEVLGMALITVQKWEQGNRNIPLPIIHLMRCLIAAKQAEQQLNELLNPITEHH